MTKSWTYKQCEFLVFQGDITLQNTVAIVNAANTVLLGGGGVDGAIHRAAGPSLLKACMRVKKRLTGELLPTGQAAVTPGFDLQAEYVIHCVGPIYTQAGRHLAADKLASCYKQAMSLCEGMKIPSVSFPSISTGIYGYPVEEAAPIALQTVRDNLGTHLKKVQFCLFDPTTLQVYAEAAKNVF